MRYLLIILGFAAGSVSAGAAGAQAGSGFDWSGLYVGAGVGLAAGDTAVETYPLTNTPGSYFTGTDFAQIDDSGSGSLRQGRPSGGLHAGFGRQFGSLLAGLEASVNALALDQERTASEAYLTSPAARYTIDQQVSADWQALVRARLGWARGNWLLYLTGGLAVTQVTLETRYRDNFFAGAVGRSSDSDTKLGWTVGLGGEYALGPSWSIRGDYAYVDFGRVDAASVVRNASFPALLNVLHHSAALRTHTLLIGLTYHFSGY